MSDTDIRLVEINDAVRNIKEFFGDEAPDDVAITNILKDCTVEGHAGFVDMGKATSSIFRKIESNKEESAKPVVFEHNLNLLSVRDFRKWEQRWTPERHFPVNSELKGILNPNKKGEMIINPTELARLFLKHVPTLNTKGSNPATYTFNADTLLWSDDESLIGRWMQCVYDSIYDNEDFPPGYSPNKAIEDAVKEVKRSAPVLDQSEYRFDASWYSYLGQQDKRGVPLNNGVLCFEERTDENGKLVYYPKIEEYSPYWLFTRKADTGYNPDADVTKAISVFSDWMPDDEEELDSEGKMKDGSIHKYMRLVQYPAQIIIHQYTCSSWKKVYYGYGPGNCGKTTFADVIGFVFGKHLGAKTKIHNLSKDFGKEAIAGKWFNTPDETHASKGVNIDEFKDVYGSNEIEVNKKYRHPEVEPMVAVGYHAGNTMMKASAEVRKDSAYLRRWIIYHFDNEFVVDPQWESKNMTKELAEGIMKLAVDTAAVILGNGKLIYEMTEKEVLDEFKQDDTVNEFIVKTFFTQYSGDIRKKKPLDLVKEGFGIPVSEMFKFFKALEAVWDTPVAQSINVAGRDNLPLNAKDLIPDSLNTISTGLTNIGIPKCHVRCQYLGDGHEGLRHWYYSIKFNDQADKIMRHPQ